MDLSDRIKLILIENGLKQKELAKVIGVTESYVSAMVNRRTANHLSQTVAKLIEEKYGYHAQWILTGEGSKLKQVGKDPLLSNRHKKAIIQIEKMNDEQIKAVLAFMKYLDEMEELEGVEDSASE